MATTVNLVAAAGKYSADVQKLEALGIVSASPALFSIESMTAAGVFARGR